MFVYGLFDGGLVYYVLWLVFLVCLRLSRVRSALSGGVMCRMLVFC